MVRKLFIVVILTVFFAAAVAAEPDIPLQSSSSFTDSYQLEDEDGNYSNIYLYDVVTEDKTLVDTVDDRYVYEVDLRFERTDFGHAVYESENDGDWTSYIATNIGMMTGISTAQGEYDNFGEFRSENDLSMLEDSLASPDYEVLRGSIVDSSELDSLDLHTNEQDTATITVETTSGGDWNNPSMGIRFGSGSTDWTVQQMFPDNDMGQMVFDPDEEYLFHSLDRRQFVMRNTDDWSVEFSKDYDPEGDFNDAAPGLAVTQDGSDYVFKGAVDGNGDGAIEIFEIDRANDDLVHVDYITTNQRVPIILIDPEHRYFAWASSDDTIRIHNLDTDNEDFSEITSFDSQASQSMMATEFFYNTMDISSSGDRIIAGDTSSSPVVNIFETVDGGDSWNHHTAITDTDMETNDDVEGVAGTVSVAFAENDDIVAMRVHQVEDDMGEDYMGFVMDITDNSIIHRFDHEDYEDSSNEQHGISFSDDYSHLIVAGNDPQIFVWSVDSNNYEFVTDIDFGMTGGQSSAIGDVRMGGYGTYSNSGADDMVLFSTATPSFFPVSITGTNSPVDEGETLTVDANVSNDDDTSAMQNVTLEINGDTVDWEERNIDAASTEIFTLEWDTQVSDAGEYTATVSSEDDSDTAEVTVEALDPAEFNVTIVDDTFPVSEGNDGTVSAEIENIGQVQGTQDVVLTRGVEELDREEDVVLDGGQSQVVDLTWSTEESDVGTHELNVSSDDHWDAVMVDVVEAAAFFDVMYVGDNSPVVPNGTLHVDGVVENTGDASGVQDIVLESSPEGMSDWTVRDTETGVSLGVGDSETVSFEWGTTGVDAGEYDVRIVSDDDSDGSVVSLGVDLPPSPELLSHSIEGVESDAATDLIRFIPFLAAIALIVMVLGFIVVSRLPA